MNVPHPQDLYALQRGNDPYIVQSYPDYLDLRDRNRSFDGLAAYNISPVALDTGKNPASRLGLMKRAGTTSTHWEFSRISAASSTAPTSMGRTALRIIVLTYAYWHSHFQDDRGVVGRVVRLNKHPFTILGVAPPEFNGHSVVLLS